MLFVYLVFTRTNSRKMHWFSSLSLFSDINLDLVGMFERSRWKINGTFQNNWGKPNKLNSRFWRNQFLFFFYATKQTIDRKNKVLIIAFSVGIHYY